MLPAKAQERYSECNVSKYRSGQKSLEVCWDKNKYWGIAVVYTTKGDTSRFWGLRKVAGHASIEVKYHANGGVSEVYFSSHPDGGIQWFQEWVNFDENGFVSNKREMKYPHETLTLKDFDPSEELRHPVPFTQIVLKNAGKKTMYLLVTDTLSPPINQYYLTVEASKSLLMLKVKVHGLHPDLLNGYRIFRVKSKNSPQEARLLKPQQVNQVKNAENLLQIEVILK
jgi:hypothetical protein